MNRLRRAGQDGEDGFAILTVLLGMLALTLVLIATAAYVGNSLPIARRGQDANGALQAAQAGVDDYLGRLGTCDAYWSKTDLCRINSKNSALTPSALTGGSGGVVGSDTSSTATGWATIPYSASSSVAQYHVDELATPATGSSVVRIRVTGRIVPLAKRAAVVKRSMVVDLGRNSLLNYIYYTDREAIDPSALVTRYPARTVAYNNGTYNRLVYSGVSATEAAKCDYYYYGATSTAARRSGTPSETYRAYRADGTSSSLFTQGYNCEIQFAPIDVVSGKLHTNDAILLNNPLFKGETTSAWPAGSTPAPSTSAWYRLVSGGSGPQAGGSMPKYGSPVLLPNSNTSIKDATDPLKGGQDGCPYTGPTRIVFKADGTMDVTSPFTTKTNSGCTTGSASAPGLGLTQNVPLPKNGVIYVEKSTASCSGKPAAYPFKSNDLTTYDCSAGDVFLEGTLKGRVTIASRSDIIVTNNVTYNSGGSGTDVLGLVAEGNVTVYHPVECATAVAAGYACDDFNNIDVGLSDITVSAAILSTQHSFTVQNFDKGAKLGKLTVFGGVYQDFRGPVGTGGGTGTGTGYAKNYTYDERLKTLPPPSFLNPIAAPWVSSTTAEVKPANQCPTGPVLPANCVPR